MRANASIGEVLQAFCRGDLTLEEAETAISGLRIEAVGDLARLDLGRRTRCGMPEVVLGEGKDVEALTQIMQRHVETSGRSIATRVSAEQARAVIELAEACACQVEYRKAGRILILSRTPRPEPTGGIVGVITAGTSDLTVAEEARAVAEEMGCTVKTAYDVGVAGIHRLFPALRDLLDAHAFVVAAGREGTLPAIVAGLVDRPVVGVPVSTGYGFMGRGEAALASMLQACSVVAVVNIDAGFTAGAFAARIANMVAEHE